MLHWPFSYIFLCILLWLFLIFRKEIAGWKEVKAFHLLEQPHFLNLHQVWFVTELVGPDECRSFGLQGRCGSEHPRPGPVLLPRSAWVSWVVPVLLCPLRGQPFVHLFSPPWPSNRISHLTDQFASDFCESLLAHLLCQLCSCSRTLTIDGGKGKGEGEM